ncbi:MAG: rhomboid family intramembrane serine protease [Acidobacteria bacterium]|nr:rhomboid family intramembrane serine protease [Acidobacteriota bacterium]
MLPLRDSQPSRTFPAVTVWLIVINVFVFLFEFSLEPLSRNHFVAEYGMVPAAFVPRSLLTSMFLHGGWMHLIGNIWFLWIYGDNVEDLLGRWRYVLFYLACAVVSALVHLMFNLGSRIPTIGASGAIAGVMGAYLITYPHARIVTLLPIIIFFTTVELPAWFILIYWFVIQFFYGFGELAASTGVEQGGVAWFAHVGGFVAGAALVKLMAIHPRYRAYPELHWR